MRFRKENKSIYKIVKIRYLSTPPHEKYAKRHFFVLFYFFFGHFMENNFYLRTSKVYF